VVFLYNCIPSSCILPILLPLLPIADPAVAVPWCAGPWCSCTSGCCSLRPSTHAPGGWQRCTWQGPCGWPPMCCSTTPSASPPTRVPASGMIPGVGPFTHTLSFSQFLSLPLSPLSPSLTLSRPLSLSPFTLPPPPLSLSLSLSLSRSSSCVCASAQNTSKYLCLLLLSCMQEPQLSALLASGHYTEPASGETHPHSHSHSPSPSHSHSHSHLQSQSPSHSHSHLHSDPQQTEGTRTISTGTPSSKDPRILRPKYLPTWTHSPVGEGALQGAGLAAGQGAASHCGRSAPLGAGRGRHQGLTQRLLLGAPMSSPGTPEGTLRAPSGGASCVSRGLV